MKTAKLVIGIICIVLSAMVIFQSCAAGLYNTVTDSGEQSGTAGIFVALLMIAGGITMIATRNATSNGGHIAAIVVFALAAIVGFTSAGTFADLNVWAALCAAVCGLNIFFLIKTKKTGTEK